MNTKSILPVILSIAGAAGVVATSIFVAKQTPKFNEDYSKLKEKKEDNTKNVVKIFVKDYALPIAIGSATIASIASSTIISKKNEMSLSAIAMIADKGWRKYKNKVKETLGIETHEDILDKISKDDAKKVDFNNYTNLYWEEHVGFFEANPESLAYAYLNLNRRLHDKEASLIDNSIPGFPTLYNLLKDSKANILDEKIKNNTNELNYGWSVDYLYESYGYVWINMLVQEENDGKNTYKKIIFAEEAIYDPMYYTSIYEDNSYELKGERV